ncbi:phosphatase PAP2 family protein [Rummeliibacillus stabekisii]|uniref:Phosphatidic acid phosphatase n=1 Tax=Rummeliibacillus stabekisii TaxID=241244 RepID=A0A143HF58_9BACL|nr:phosphatase PAP2 family protein [Rummeliibacillus stabekisii]AMX00131.1 phosphatidic acid phosphatase [Rummeliibacillus stabekisii]
MNLDYQIFKLINQFAGKSIFIDHLVLYFSKYGPLLFGLFFIWLWFSKSKNKEQNQKIVLSALTIVILTLGIDMIIEIVHFRSRPFVDHPVTLLFNKSNRDPSFPSNHAAGSFALAFAVFWVRRKAGGILLGLACVMALSRIYIGVHYPLDVLVGGFIGFFVSLVVMTQARILNPFYNFIIDIFNKHSFKNYR